MHRVTAHQAALPFRLAPAGADLLGEGCDFLAGRQIGRLIVEFAGSVFVSRLRQRLPRKVQVGFGLLAHASSSMLSALVSRRFGAISHPPAHLPESPPRQRLANPPRFELEFRRQREDRLRRLYAEFAKHGVAGLGERSAACAGALVEFDGH